MSLRSPEDRMVKEHLVTEKVFLQFCFFVFAISVDFLLKQILENCKKPKSPTCNGEDGCRWCSGRGIGRSPWIRDGLSHRVFYVLCCRFCNFFKICFNKKQKAKMKIVCRSCPGTKKNARRPRMMSSPDDLNFPEISGQYCRL